MKLRFVAAIAILSLSIVPLGCNTFERNTFNTLSATKAVLDTAQADYEAGVIPKTQCAFTLITDAKVADVAAVNAMVVYEQEKSAGSDVQAQQAVVIGDLASLAGLYAKVQTLIANPIAACGGK